MSMPSPTEFELLLIVAPAEISGREISDRFAATEGKPISPGTLYTTLRRMREAGWLTVRDDKDVDGRLRFYRITSGGRRALSDVSSRLLRLGKRGVRVAEAF